MTEKFVADQINKIWKERMLHVIVEITKSGLDINLMKLNIEICKWIDELNE